LEILQLPAIYLSKDLSLDICLCDIKSN